MSRHTQRTNADERSESRNTRTAVTTRTGQTGIKRRERACLTKTSGERRQTGTDKAVGSINTRAAVLARIGSAFVDVGLTESARITSSTRATE
jgi:hypothetical protein